MLGRLRTRIHNCLDGRLLFQAWKLGGSVAVDDIQKILGGSRRSWKWDKSGTCESPKESGCRYSPGTFWGPGQSSASCHSETSRGDKGVQVMQDQKCQFGQVKDIDLARQCHQRVGRLWGSQNFATHFILFASRNFKQMPWDFIYVNIISERVPNSQND